MRALWVGVFLSATLVPVSRADDLLARKSGCTACHSVNERVVGPAFREVAERYREKSEAVDYLALKIRQGGIGIWGQSPMPPQPGVSEADARALATWILGR